MRKHLRFITALVVGLAIATWIASAVVQRTTRAWFERDVTLRAQLAVTGAQRALVASWNGDDTAELRAILSEITQDERIMSAAACLPDGRTLTTTPEMPARASCERVAARSTGAIPWAETLDLRGGSAHVSVIPLLDQQRVRGSVVLVHDLSYADRRERVAQRFLLAAFALLALTASVVTILAERIARRSWLEDLRRLLRTGGERSDLRPILDELHLLANRLAARKEVEDEGGAWTPNRLKQVLRRHLDGERVVIVANREPYIHQRQGGGGIEVIHPASGLVTALEPVMRTCSGVWVAHGSGSADRETVDANDRVRVPPGDESYLLRRVWLSEDEEKGYYYGFSNEGLWPLCHTAHARPVFRGGDWEAYRAVNERFANAVCDEVDSEDPIVLVQDYHFALAPRLIRERLPRATILTFWHIPWPSSQRLGICPWREELLDGLLGSSILGFHTQFDCNNFIDSVDRFLEARIDREHTAIIQQGRSTLVRPYPISLEWPNRWLRGLPAHAECRARVLADLSLPEDALIGVGVDRLDYTKGVEERLLAVERLLERYPAYRGRFIFIQLAAPSRTVIEHYRQLNDAVEGIARRVNERFGTSSYRPIILLRAHHEPPAVFRHLRAADVLYVSSLHDGMNLVAKEFVAARDDERGVLVLSQFTGAARELTEALIVNPYDLDQASAALRAALTMSAEEQRERMRAMRAHISEFNVYRWAGRMLVDAARLRTRERLSGKLTGAVVAEAS